MSLAHFPLSRFAFGLHIKIAFLDVALRQWQAVKLKGCDRHSSAKHKGFLNHRRMAIQRHSSCNLRANAASKKRIRSVASNGCPSASEIVGLLLWCHPEDVQFLTPFFKR